jgi:sulfatase modifying factor 1
MFSDVLSSNRAFRPSCDAAGRVWRIGWVDVRIEPVMHLLERCRRMKPRICLFLAFTAIAASGLAVARGPIKEAEIVFLLQSGVSSRRIETLIQRHGVDFDATAERLDVIRASGGTGALIDALKAIQPARVSAPPPPASSQPSSSSPSSPSSRAVDLNPAIRLPGIEPSMILVNGGPGDRYYIGRHEMTNAQYFAYCKAAGVAQPKAPYWGTPNRLPVVNVSWNEAMAFAHWLSRATRRTYRLPTEAEWEFAARGGERIRTYPWGEADPVGRCCFGSGKLCPVGSFLPNTMGIHDMAGNVYEWCLDRMSPKGKERVIRGGGWSVPMGSPELLATTNRDGLDADKRRNDLGFRLVREIR